MNNGDKPASPLRGGDGTVWKFQDGYLDQCGDDMAMGLTKREHFAVMAMNAAAHDHQGFDNEMDSSDWENIAANSIGIADALLKALEQQK